MLLRHPLHGGPNLGLVPLGLLYGGGPVGLGGPSRDVALELGVFPLLLLDVLAQLAVLVAQVGAVDELEPARLARAVFLVALVAEMTPSPVAAGPACLVIPAHFCVIFFFGFFFFFFLRERREARGEKGEREWKSVRKRSTPAVYETR
ncbi:hypothetical protein GGS20DRAFT_57278 [Poronia punctata]|nr:hypothetical protein GGS20DRAFT_57278 [Poronia punctata]